MSSNKANRLALMTPDRFKFSAANHRAECLKCHAVLQLVARTGFPAERADNEKQLADFAARHALKCFEVRVELTQKEKRAGFGR